MRGGPILIASADKAKLRGAIVRALVWRGRRDVRVESVADPALVNPHDAIVRVTATAVCSADVHLYASTLRPGAILGHEFVGEIVDVGPACELVRPGDRVAVMCAIACGRCWFCTHDLYAACDNAAPAGTRVEVDHASGHSASAVYGPGAAFGGYAGAQAELVRVPFADVGCVVVPAELTDVDAVLVGDALPVGYRAAESCGLGRGDTVAVFGCGPVGQLAIRSAFVLGAERVIAVDNVSPRLALAADGGAIIVDDRRGNVAARLAELTGGTGPDACIDAREDRGSALRDAIRACRKGGTVSIASVHGGFERLPIAAAFHKGLTLRLGQTHFHRYKGRCIEAVRSRVIDPGCIVTHRVALDDLPDAYRMLHARADGCIQVVARL